MIDVEVLGADAGAVARARTQVPPASEIECLCTAAAASVGVRDGHLAIEFVDAQRIAALNARYRGEQRPTDVLSFPIDGPDAAAARAPTRARAHARSGARGSTPDGAGGSTPDGAGGSTPDGAGGSTPDGAGESTPDGDAARAGVRARAREEAPERELGDVVICLAHTADVREAIVHGVLHLMGMDHETDDGEMLALQRTVLARARA